MAISIDTVYQRVLALANKEQRGYITPQEFNLFANQAQGEIFEQYFYDVNQVARVPGNDYVHADVDDMLEEKMQIFQNQAILGPNIPNFVYRVYRIESSGINCEILKTSDFNDAINGGPLTKPTATRPIANIRTNTLRVSIGKGFLPSANVFYFSQPIQVRWGYVVVGSKPLYDPTYTTNFELHQSEESELVYKILKLAGVSMKRDDIMRAGQGMEISQVQQEKQ